MGEVTVDRLEVRPATTGDLPQILELMRLALGWSGRPADAAFFRWKHLDNPFGASPMWVATHPDADGIVAFRTFMRWRFLHGTEPVEAVRAVDTATHPEFQGRGIFSRLTRHALEELRAQGVAFVFNTPNDRSRPGYLKMGWQPVGRLPVRVLPSSVRTAASLLRAGGPAELDSLPSQAGQAASAVFGSAGPEDLPPPSADGALRTDRSSAYLRWRYGHEPLCYRVLRSETSAGEGMVVFRVRERRALREVVVAEVLAAGASDRRRRALVREALRAAGGHYAIGLRGPADAGGLPVPRRACPFLLARALRPSGVPELAAWSLSMGDVELF